ncbi:MAG: glycosyl transferase family protein, partial [Acidobacteriaceae bacterium]|nr:glycosyl transferase family protein [Acidobacteriaceae bacterium]
MHKITVIIPTFNRERYVQRAIESALNQSFRDYEIVVVDDGSTDNTRSALRRYDDKIHYACQVNRGASAARNRGIQVASGEWLAFLDSDDEWDPSYLARQMEQADNNPTVCMQSTDAWIVELDGDKHSYFSLNGSL